MSVAMPSRNILFEKSERIATITLNDPVNRNSISGSEIVDELVSAIESVNRDRDISVLVLTGNGSAFSSGGDIKAMRERIGIFGGSPLLVEQGYRHGIQRIPLALHALEVPTIAAVNGPAIGAGCDLALMCDIRIASTKARFGETFLNLGIIPGDGGAWFLPRIVGYQRAAEIIFSGRIVDAEEAKQIGLVLKVVEPDKLLEMVHRLATEIAAKPPAALRMAKRLLHQSSMQQLPEFLEICAAFQSLAHHTLDHAEAIEAFFEKRSGNYKGE